MQKAPIGKKCAIETQMLQYWRVRYLEDYSVDPNDFTEVGMISELAELELYLWRLNTQLSRPEDAMLVTDQLIGVTPQGKKLYEKQLSPFFEAKEKLLQRKSRLVKLLVGDRQEKYKKQAALKTRAETDPSTMNAEMRKLMENLLAKNRELATESQPQLPSSTKDADGYMTFDVKQ